MSESAWTWLTEWVLVRREMDKKGVPYPMRSVGGVLISLPEAMQCFWNEVFHLINHWSLWCRRVWCQTYGYFPSCRASPPFDWYQVILLDDRGTCVKNLPKFVTWKRNGKDSNPLPFELQIRCSNHYATKPHGQKENIILIRQKGNGQMGNCDTLFTSNWWIGVNPEE